MLTAFVLSFVLAQAPQGSPAPAVPATVEKHAGWLHAAIAAHVVAQAADLSTTSFAMGRGGFRESNPMMRPFAGDPVRLALVKGAYAVGTSYLFLRLHKTRPKLAFALAAGTAAFTSYIAARNSRVVQSGRR